MIDIITYIPNLTLFRVEANEKADQGNPFFSFTEDGTVLYNVSKIPVVYKDLESVCLIRLIKDEEIEEFSSLTSCSRIGICTDGEYVFDSEAGKIIYESVYDTKERMIEIDGEQISYKPPYNIGMFS